MAIRWSINSIAQLMAKLVPPEQLAPVIDCFLSCDCNELLNENEAELGAHVFEALCEASPAAMTLAQQGTPPKPDESELLEAARWILRSAGYESGEAEPTLRELNVSRKHLDDLRDAIAHAEGK